MKETIKGVAMAVSMVLGFFLMLGAEGGIVQGTLTGGSGWWVMLIGMVMLAAPVLWMVLMDREEDEDDQDQIG